jgi:hypothetical protein
MEYIETTLGKLPVNYGMNALAMFSEMRNKSMDEVVNLNYDNLNLMDIMAMLYAGVKDGARKAGEECKIKTLADFNDFTEENEKAFIELKTLFAKQQGKTEEGKKEETKKK